MGKEVNRKRYSLSVIILLLSIGFVFTALGVYLCVALIASICKDGDFNAFFLVPFIFVILLVGFGVTGLVWGGKRAYNWARFNKAKRSKTEAFAKIVDYKISYNGSKNRSFINKRYSLTLSYDQDGQNKTFKTDYLYDMNEFRYLKSLDKVKIKIDGNFAVVAETFTEDIYTHDSTYGIEMSFYKQKHVAITLKILRIAEIIAVALLFVFIGLTVALDNGLFFIIGAIVLFAVNMPFAVILAVFFIRWMIQN